MSATFCEVEVDTETGEVEITHWAAAHDVGKAIRPSSIEGQVEAQFIWSTGSFKTEEVIWDKKTGVLLNGNDLDYKMPTILDVAPNGPDYRGDAPGQRLLRGFRCLSYCTGPRTLGLCGTECHRQMDL